MSDYIIRATAADDQMRIFAATTKEITEEARRIHNLSPTATAALGRLLTAGAIMGGMQKNSTDVLTLQIKGDGPVGGLTVTSGFFTKSEKSDGRLSIKEKVYVKGYANNPSANLPPNAKGKLDVGGLVGRGTLTVIKDMGLKEPFAGQTELISGEIAEDLTYYYANSEQIPSSVALGVLVGKEGTKCAGGFIVQLLPFAEDALIDRLEKKLTGIPSVTSMLDKGMSPEDLVNEVFGEFDVTIADRIEAEYHCNCSKEKVMKAVESISANDLREMIKDNKPVEVGCYFCGRKYEFNTEELKNIVKSKKTH